MRILLTGFEPFGTHTANPSMLLAEKLGGTVLPVSAERMPDALEAAVRHHRPDAVLGLGLAAARTQVAIERVGLNLLDFTIPDNDGALVTDMPIDPDGPPARFATVPVKEIAAAWLAEEIPSFLSNTAGTYICNQFLYVALGMGERDGFVAGFIHLPPADAVPIATQERAVRIALAVLGSRTILSFAGTDLPV